MKIESEKLHPLADVALRYKYCENVGFTVTLDEVLLPTIIELGVQLYVKITSGLLFKAEITVEFPIQRFGVPVKVRLALTKFTKTLSTLWQSPFEANR